jgi:hypothetical protein
VRIPKHVNQGGDPLERRLDLGLRPPGVQLGLDLLQLLEHG